jgi:hypothetical protein
MFEQPLVGQGHLVVQALLSHTQFDTPHSIRLLCTNDQPDAETSTWQHTTLLKGRYPCPWRESNPVIPASELLQTHVLGHVVTEMGWIRGIATIIKNLGLNIININLLFAWGPGRFAPKQIMYGTSSVKAGFCPRCDKDVGRRK